MKYITKVVIEPTKGLFMLDSSRFTKKSRSRQLVDVDIKGNIVDDIKLWIERYLEHLLSLNRSNNTIDTNKVVLEAFNVYLGQVITNKMRLSESNQELLSDFVIWCEEMKINKVLGHQNLRIELLVEFINKSSAVTSYYEMLAAYNEYLNSLSVQDNHRMAYIYDYFSNYYEVNEIPFTKIDELYLTDVLATIPKNSASTQMQRRSLFVGFLEYISITSGEAKFSQYAKELPTITQKKVINNQAYRAPFTKRESNKLKAFLKNYPSELEEGSRRQLSAYRDSFLLMLMLHAGLRTSEAISLRPHDIEVMNEHIIITVEKGKGNKKRETIMPLDLAHKHVAFLLGYSEGSGSNETFSSLFTKNDNAISRQHLSQTAQAFYLFAGLKNKKGLHILRHQFASEMATNPKVSTLMLQNLLGHSDSKTTAVYTHSILEDVMKAIV